MTYSATKFEVALSYRLREIHLKENTLFDLDLGVKITRNVAQYPLYHVTYSATKFEVASSNRLGGDTFTRNVTDTQTDRQTTDRLWYEINLQSKLFITSLVITEYSMSDINLLGTDLFTLKFPLFDRIFN